MQLKKEQPEQTQRRKVRSDKVVSLKHVMELGNKGETRDIICLDLGLYITDWINLQGQKVQLRKELVKWIKNWHKNK